jgi:hypothetical protein
MAFVQPTILALALAVVDAFATKSSKIRYSKDIIEYEKITALEARVRAIKGVDLYDPIQAVTICLVPNMVVLKKFLVSKFIKYTKMYCPSTHLKSYYNKMVAIIHDEKLLIHFFQDNLNSVVFS